VAISTEAARAPLPPAPLAHRQILVVFSGLLLVMLLAALDSTIVATALPTIVGELGGVDRLAWVVTAYLLAQTIVTPLYGKLGDLYGRKPVLQVAIGLFLLGSVLCGLSRNMLELVLFRGLQGLGGGGLMVTTQAVVGDIVPPRERGRYQGSSARCSASRASRGRSSAATSPRTSPGAGSSTSTCRSAPSPSPCSRRRCRRAARSTTARSTTPAPRCSR
jgi:hypothetical protein